MRLYLVRHGEAVQAENDSERVLTKEGRERVRKTAYFLRKNNINVKIIFHSGKTRARETAQIIAEEINPVNGIAESAGLKPNDPVKVWMNNVRDLTSDTMIVGHLPQLSKLLSNLTTGDIERDLFLINDASVICLEKSDDSWMVRWFVTPDIL
jgi:phosphohistidine phosphatase